MELEEIKSRYKAIALWKRLLFFSILSLIPSVYSLIEEYSVLTEEKEVAITNKNKEEKKYNQAKEKKLQLPDLEKKLNQTQNELDLARKKIPDEFYMDQVLQRTALLAQNMGLKLISFDPDREEPSNTAFKYVSLAVKIKISGNYKQITSFFDRLVHLDLLVHVRNFHMSLTKDEAVSSQVDESKLSVAEIQELERSKTKISSTADMVVYRSLTDEEDKAIQEGIKKAEVKEEKEKVKEKVKEKNKSQES